MSQKMPTPNAIVDGFLFDTSLFDPVAQDILLHFQDLVLQNHPLNSRQRAELSQHIRTLSHNLTDKRGERRVSYLNTPATLSAYVHYFAWWNLVRLSRLFSNIPADFFSYPSGSSFLDIGSGPLTVPLSLFIAQPKLRDMPLTWYCMDISSQALRFGEDIFLSAMARAKKAAPWNIVRIKGNFLSENANLKHKMNLVTCANVFNEALQSTKGTETETLAQKYAATLLSYTKEDNASVLVVEPGVPSCGQFISLFRTALMQKQFFPVSPCTHCKKCALDGKRKWCNFAFSTETAPKSLLRLSESARLPKERAVLSFLAAKKGNLGQNTQPKKEKSLRARITSDRLPLPEHRFGYYACSEEGLLLIETKQVLQNGAIISTTLPPAPFPRDKKTGAIILSCMF